MPQHQSLVPQYNNTQQYLLLADLGRSLFWFAVHARFLLLIPLTGVRFLPGGIADFYLCVNVITGLLDAFDYATIFSKMPRLGSAAKPSAFSLATTVLQRLVVSGAILCYPKIARSNSFATLIYAESLAEMLRSYYNFYKVRSFGRKNRTLALLKKTGYTALVPVQVACELLLLFDSLRHDNYYPELREHDFALHTATRLLMLFYLPLLYLTYKRKMTEWYYRGVLGHEKTQ